LGGGDALGNKWAANPRNILCANPSRCKKSPLTSEVLITILPVLVEEFNY